jgi:monoamine oxidase
VSEVKVAIVGAGLAGLAAADVLAREGAEVVVLEARERIGGRVWSQPFAGGVAERGAEFVFESDDVLRTTAERLGLRLYRKGTLYGAREPRGGQPVSAAEVEAAASELRSLSSEGTVAEALDGSGIPPAAREVIRARIEISSAYPADDLAASVLAETGAGFGSFDTHGIEGGNSRLARGLAAHLAVHVGSPVEAVVWSDRSVRLHGSGLEVDADRAVIAVPATAAQVIRFDPPLPAAKGLALAGVRYGQAAKLHVPLRAPFEPSAVLAVPDRYWSYTQLDPDGLPAGFAATFAGTDAALARLQVDEGPKRWLEVLAELRPELDLEPGGVMLTTWRDDPWSLGAYSAPSFSSPLHTEELARPVGPLAFAGEHTAGDWHGLMEGALRSGLRAAEDLLSVPAGR